MTKVDKRIIKSKDLLELVSKICELMCEYSELDEVQVGDLKNNLFIDKEIVDSIVMALSHE